MKFKVLSALLSALLIVVLIYTYTLNKGVAYNDFQSTVKKISAEFKPDQFSGINLTPEAAYAHITSYPSTAWTKENNNSYKGNSIEPRQIDYYYLNQGKSDILTKITFFYDPQAKTRDYIKVDYFDQLSNVSDIEASYQNLIVIPHYEVGFKGKGYNVYVQTTYLDEYYKNNPVSADENLKLITINAEMVRLLQDFLIKNKL